MTIEQAKQSMDSLRNRESNLIRIQKEDFLTFRHELVKQPDFKYFRGIARHGGHVDYEYMNVPRS
ncbi:hypothetical protein [Domibacillus epiphyticus]|uniref:Abortive phage infection protein n=1 Tax=Domibacillus epiphyticus TaxID=1714355 RepID=A0A1V2A5D8_9BACI|nr:hypothetical protein [Domibacillus epiphyticus]OMP66203.1 hypothetical protein BTO28_13505 [Domibacillus epiphyticus]